MASDDEDGGGAPVGENSASTAMREPEEAVDFFRNKISLVQRMEEKRRKAQAKKQKAERRRSSQTASVERADPAVQDNKRRRVSREDDGDNEDEFEEERAPSASYGTRSPSPTTRARNSSSKSAQTKQPQGSPNTLSEKYSQLTGNQSKLQKSQSANITILSDSDDDLRPASNPGGKHQDVKLIDDSDDDFPNSRVTSGTSNNPRDEALDIDNHSQSEDDDDFAHLAATKAKKALEGENKPPTSEISGEQSKEDILKAKLRERLEQFQRTGSLAKSASDSSTPKRTPSNPPAFDPKIEIFVTSTIEGTKPLMFIRKLSQRLKEVRQSWCDRQEIEMTASQKESIFLTWKGNKVWDSTTCKRMLNLQVKDDKLVTFGEGFQDGQLHMEAWTAATFDEYKREKASRQIYTQDEAEEQPEEEVIPEPEETKIRIVLKAKGMEDFKLAVKDHTRIAKIISSFQSKRDIAENKEILLRFDGELLDPEGFVKDTDLEDFDVIEVQIK